MFFIKFPKITNNSCRLIQGNGYLIALNKAFWFLISSWGRFDWSYYKHGPKKHSIEKLHSIGWASLRQVKTIVYTELDLRRHGAGRGWWRGYIEVGDKGVNVAAKDVGTCRRFNVVHLLQCAVFKACRKWDKTDKKLQSANKVVLVLLFISNFITIISKSIKVYVINSYLSEHNSYCNCE